MAQHMRSAARPRRGLTLIELMVVVALLGIIGVLAAPSFNQMFARNALRGAAAEAYADLQYARSEAVQRNAAVTLAFSSGGYTISRGGQPLKTVTLSGGTTIDSGATMSVVFDPVRATAAVNDGPVVFSHPRTTGTLRVAVNLLGRVELCSPSASVPGVASC